MKYAPKFSSEINKKHLINMTWDLYLIDKFFENWVKKPEHREFIYASNDRPLKDVLKLAIEIQNNGENSSLSKDLSESLTMCFINMFSQQNTDLGRRITEVNDFKTFRDGVIHEHEVLLRVRG